ncbi:MAG: zinc metallopeptidase [Lachnospirales bacterium]
MFYYGYGLGGGGVDSLLYLLLIITFIVSMYFQVKVSSTFSKYSKVGNSRGMTGADVAAALLRLNGITDVRVEHISGNLTDHYDPSKKVIRLSDGVYGSQSVSALSVAAHETGHALQHAKGYFPLTLRSAIFPVVNLSSRLAIPLFIIGLLLGGSYVLAQIGAILFAAVVVFHIVTLPVEFNASSRALNMLTEYGYLSQTEVKGARKVLGAAAMTYVAAAATALLQLLRLLAIIGNRRD